MSHKRCKRIRRAMRLSGFDPNERSYDRKVAKIVDVVTLDLNADGTNKIVRMPRFVETLRKGCGREIYRAVKRLAARG